MMRVLPLLKIITAAAIPAILYCAYRFSGAKRNAACAAGMCLCYGLFHKDMYVNMFYLICGAFVYVIPTLFLFGVLFINKKLRLSGGGRRRSMTILGCALGFFVGISQEQLSSTLAFTLIMLCVFEFGEARKVSFNNALICAFSIAGAALLYMAPGNFKRVMPLYDTVPALDRIMRNVELFMSALYNKDNMPFLFIFGILVVYLSYRRYWNKSALGKEACICVAVWTVAQFPLTAYAKPFLEYEVVDMKSIVNLANLVNLALYTEFSVWMILAYLYERKDERLIAFFVGSYASVLFACVYAAYILPRMTITFILSLFIVIIKAFSESGIGASRRNALVGAGAIVPISALLITLSAYRYNYSILRRNDENMRAAVAQFERGEPLEPVVFDNGALDLRYIASGIPYLPEEYMKKYYAVSNEFPLIIKQ
jgi:hypothetical protein